MWDFGNIALISFSGLLFLLVWVKIYFKIKKKRIEDRYFNLILEAEDALENGLHHTEVFQKVNAFKKGLRVLEEAMTIYSSLGTLHDVRGFELIHLIETNAYDLLTSAIKERLALLSVKMKEKIGIEPLYPILKVTILLVNALYLIETKAHGLEKQGETGQGGADRKGFVNTLKADFYQIFLKLFQVQMSDDLFEWLSQKRDTPCPYSEELLKSGAKIKNRSDFERLVKELAEPGEG